MTPISHDSSDRPRNGSMQPSSAVVEEPAEASRALRTRGARRFRQAVLAWALSAVALALLVGTWLLIAQSVLTLANGGPILPAYTYLTNGSDLLPFEVVADALSFAALIAFAAIGALIVTRYPTHPIGWILCALSLFGAT